MRHATVALVAVLVGAAGACGSNSAAQSSSTTTMAPRPALYDTCPPSGIEAPASMTLADRELPNLGGGALGRIDVYDGTGTRLEITVGIDILNTFEDLDFESEQVRVAGAPATLSTAGAFGTVDTLVVLTWTDHTLPQPCQELALVGTNISKAELLALAEAPRVPPATPSP